MKKTSILKKAFVVMLCVLAGLVGRAQTVVLLEDFTLVADSNTMVDISSNLDNYTSVSGWTGNKIYRNNGKIKLGTSSVLGWIMTPALDLSANNGNFTLSFDAIAWYNDSTALKVYVDDTEYTITGLDNSGSYGTYGHYTLNLAGGTANTHIKITGNQPSKGRFFLDNIVVTINNGIQSAALPTFSEASGFHSSPFTLTLSCATPNADIYYTTDGTTPNENSTLYTTPLTISQTTTIKAIAYATGYGPSTVATATYNFPTPVANIAAFKATATSTNTTPYTITGDVTFVYRDGAYMFVKDASGALLIYDNTVITTEYNEGDIISGGITGTLSVYSNQYEMVPLFNTPAATSSETVTPIEATIADITTNYSQYDAQFVTLRGVTLTDGISYVAGTSGQASTISQNGSDMALYNRFKTLDTTMAAGTVTDITGFMGIYGTTIQIYPRNNADLIPGAAPIPQLSTPIITPGTGIYADSVIVTITSENAGAEIRYTLDGSTPDETSTLYTGAFTLTATTTVKAIAFQTDWTASEMATETFTIAHNAIMAVNPTSLTFNSTTLTQDIAISSAFLTDPITLTVNDPHFTLSMSSIPATTTAATVTVTFDGTEPATGIITLTSGTLSEQVTLTATAQLPMPVITPVPNEPDSAFIVSIDCSEASASIYYTTDGTQPTAASTLYTAPFELNVPGTYTVNAIAIATDWENSAVATAVYTVLSPVTPTIADTLAYFTGFEATEGYTLGTQYNNSTEALNGPSNQQWGIIYGTVSTTSPISDASSLQMRWYTTAAEILGSARTAFDITHATRITFKAKSTNNLNVLVSYSTDGGNSYVDSLYTLTSMSQDYELIVSETAQYDNVRFKFTIALPETAPTSTSRVYIDSVNIYNFPSLISGTVEMPVISPNAGLVFDTTLVSITCATDGASIYYTTDGSTPDENATLYDNPFYVTSNTTVKAKAYKASFTESNVASATYTFPVEVANIAAFKAATGVSSNTVYKITGDVTFVFESGYNFYIQDATGGLLIYDNQNVITGEYNEGDVISGGIFGHCSMYNGLLEMVPNHDLAAASGNTGTITPVVVDIEGIEAQYNQYESRLVTLQGVTFTAGGTFTTSSATNLDIMQNGETMQVRNNFKTVDMTIPAGAIADVTGFILSYTSSSTGETAYQIAPRDNNDIQLQIVDMDTVETPEIEVNKLTNDMYAVDLTCATDGATIYYTTDGTTPDENATEYTSSFTTEGGTTIKAIAIKEGMVNSAIAVYANVSVNDVSIDNINVYPNPTSSELRIENGGLSIENVMVYDVFGKLLETMSGDVHSINMSGYTPGTYFLRISTESGMIVKKVVRQ